MQIVVDSLLTNYVRQGSGRVVVILHGWGDSSDNWVQLAKTLEKQYDIVIPDLPGFGKSQSPASAWDLTDYANFLKSFLGKLGVKGPYAIIGHSNGGAIAIRSTGKNIIDCEKLVLLSSAGIRGEYKGRVKTLRYAAKATKMLVKPLSKKTQDKLRSRAYATIGSDMLVSEKLQETFKKTITDDVREDATNIQIPTLIIYGEEDKQTPLKYGELFHELINYSTLEVLPHTGHFLQLDRPDEVKNSIEEFLK